MRGTGRKTKRLKSVDVVNEKTFQPGLRAKKEKPRFDGEIWMIRDLDNKGHGQNKVLCSSSEVELPWLTTM